MEADCLVYYSRVSEGFPVSLVARSSSMLKEVEASLTLGRAGKGDMEGEGGGVEAGGLY